MVHGLRKILEGGVLAGGKLVDDGCRRALRLGRCLELLIGVEETPVHFDVVVVLVVSKVSGVVGSRSFSAEPLPFLGHLCDRNSRLAKSMVGSSRPVLLKL
jgi:hypothetical protein